MPRSAATTACATTTARRLPRARWSRCDRVHGLHCRLAELLDLPPSQVGDLEEILDRLRHAAGDRLETLARAQDAGVEVESLRGLVSHRAQRIDPRIEVGVLV